MSFLDAYFLNCFRIKKVRIYSSEPFLLLKLYGEILSSSEDMFCKEMCSYLSKNAIFLSLFRKDGIHFPTGLNLLFRRIINVELIGKINCANWEWNVDVILIKNFLNLNNSFASCKKDVPVL